MSASELSPAESAKVRAFGLDTELDGATDPGEPNAWPSNAGEFAARWNEWAPERREDFVWGAVENSQIAMACFVGDHSHAVDELHRLQAPVEP